MVQLHVSRTRALCEMCVRDRDLSCWQNPACFFRVRLRQCELLSFVRVLAIKDPSEEVWFYLLLFPIEYDIIERVDMSYVQPVSVQAAETNSQEVIRANPKKSNHGLRWEPSMVAAAPATE
jgi:hypothetical protein